MVKQEYKCANFTIKTASKYKYQIVMKTTEQNTSKQVSARKLHSEMYKYLKIFFF